VLFRTNAQARLVEERFIIQGIPYDVVGGTNFYARREVKDLLAYLKTIENGQDDLAVARIINVPKRGVGQTSLQRIRDYADERNINLFEALGEAEQISGLGKAAAKVTAFVAMIKSFRKRMQAYNLVALLTDIIDTTGYVEELEASDELDAQNRIEHIDELLNKVASFTEENPEATLADFLDEVALVADIDQLDNEGGKVVLMTLHSAKGLEFPYVYIAGLEDGIFPGYMSINADDPEVEIEEERRLAYVGMTRAEEELTLTCAKQRMLHGETRYNAVSRFLKEIPDQLLDNRLTTFRKMKVTVPVRDYTAPEKKPYVGGQTLKHSGIGMDMPTMGMKPDYEEGDRVTHVKYGIGTVRGIEQGSKDYQVTVDFDTAGQKIMYAAFAKLKRV
jgi:DNA helicase-2/ATP-dependent DNA helicase PcrA